ncbi:hypothetical protein [Oryzomicrobium sp.]|uniref:hypothetical protein n=1 Tax=Oryzomicrobium sp. TaxID=1911578 RepID=UPI002FE2FCE1
MKWKNWFVRDGNLTYSFSWLLIFSGSGLGFAGLRFADSYFFQALFVSLGLFIAAIGGYSGKARVLGLKPFDTAPWRRVRKTYEDSPDT